MSSLAPTTIPDLWHMIRQEFAPLQNSAQSLHAEVVSIHGQMASVITRLDKHEELLDLIASTVQQSTILDQHTVMLADLTANQ